MNGLFEGKEVNSPILAVSFLELYWNIRDIFPFIQHQKKINEYVDTKKKRVVKIIKAQFNHFNFLSSDYVFFWVFHWYCHSLISPAVC